MDAGMDLKLQPLAEAITAYLERLRDLGYADSTIGNKRQCCVALLRFAKQQEATLLTADLVTAFLMAEGAIEKLGTGTLNRWQQELCRTMRALTDCANHGFLPQRQKTLCIPQGWQEAVGGYLGFAGKHRGLAQDTIRGRERDLSRFTQFADINGAATPQALTGDLISSYFLSLSHYQPNTLALVVSALRCFLKYLLMSGMIARDWRDRLPHIRFAHAERLPAIWRHEEVEALLAAVDRSSPVGKRDFAILLLAARMGMRVGEIRALRLDDLHWEKASIEFVQSKTGTPQSLPLTEEVGSALIDYLRNGRPRSHHREVFLRCRAPFEPFAYTNNMPNLIGKYRRKAGIRFASKRKKGMHSLRHTVASRLLETGVGFETISGILGHISPDTTQQYARVDLAALRAVALDLEEANHE